MERPLAPLSPPRIARFVGQELRGPRPIRGGRVPGDGSGSARGRHGEHAVGAHPASHPTPPRYEVDDLRDVAGKPGQAHRRCGDRGYPEPAASRSARWRAADGVQRPRRAPSSRRPMVTTVRANSRRREAEATVTLFAPAVDRAAVRSRERRPDRLSGACPHDALVFWAAAISVVAVPAGSARRALVRLTRAACARRTRQRPPAGLQRSWPTPRPAGARPARPSS
jgi:hypothetical protein